MRRAAGPYIRARKRPSAILIHVEDAISNFFLRFLPGVCLPRADSCDAAQLRLQELRQCRPITIRAEGAVAASASGRKPAPYPAVGGSLGIERVAVHTPGHRLPCIAGSSARQETPPRHRSAAPSALTAVHVVARTRAPIFPTSDSPPAATSGNRSKIILY